jgi:hypothetical protein
LMLTVLSRDVEQTGFGKDHHIIGTRQAEIRSAGRWQQLDGYCYMKLMCCSANLTCWKVVQSSSF